MIQTKNLSKNDKIANVIWWSLWFISLVSLLLVIETYVKGGSDYRDPKWMEMVIIPFYFTIQSNLLAFIVATMVCFKLIKNNQKLRILETFMTVNLIVTLVVYWVVIFPDNASADLFGWLRNITLHALTPLLAVAIFIFKYTQLNNNLEKRRPFVSSLLHLTYPAIYIVIAISIYFILGGDEEDAIYSFLKVKTHFTAFIIYLFGIAFFYYGLTVLFIFIANRREQKPNK